MADRIGRVVPRYWEGVAAALFLLVAADLLTTVYAARAVGVGAEANPVVRWALRRGSGRSSPSTSSRSCCSSGCSTRSPNS
ncbi:hypothetical protein [Halosegnis marinus]|uniref:hypothetical protein n=1 Tax=Halosegnis marinus TaxID=3034023 RepID=UPI00360AE93E